MLIIAGTGGFGRETLDAILAYADTDSPSKIKGCEVSFVDDSRIGDVVRGIMVLGSKDVSAGPYVAAIADAPNRQELVTTMEKRGCHPTSIVHPRCIVSPESVISNGCILLAQAFISSSVYLGRHVQVNYNATVGHDTTVDDYVTILPGANISGRVHLGQGCTVGAGAVVLPRLIIGAGAMIGAGAVVTRNVAAGATVMGVPAR